MYAKVANATRVGVSELDTPPQTAAEMSPDGAIDIRVFRAEETAEARARFSARRAYDGLVLLTINASSTSLIMSWKAVVPIAFLQQPQTRRR